jgi:hypothetical protein
MTTSTITTIVNLSFSAIQTGLVFGLVLGVVIYLLIKIS